jgi:D-sedoheptulose 7-phosphate isomerase
MVKAFTLAAHMEQLASVVLQNEWSGINDESLTPEAGEEAALRLIQGTSTTGGKIYVIGNGGSAAIASHAVTDFVNNNGLRATTLHEPALLTCLTNDYGYETAFARLVERMAEKIDVLVAISSSGRSANILNAAEKMRTIGGTVFTLSGFDLDNSLRNMGNVNIWVNSHNYGLVETVHGFILHHLADRLHLEDKERMT